MIRCFRCEAELRAGDHACSWTIQAADHSFTACFELCGECDAAVEADKIAQELLHIRARRQLQELVRMAGVDGRCGHA